MTFCVCIEYCQGKWPFFGQFYQDYLSDLGAPKQKMHQTRLGSRLSDMLIHQPGSIISTVNISCL